MEKSRSTVCRREVLKEGGELVVLNWVMVRDSYGHLSEAAQSSESSCTPWLRLQELPDSGGLFEHLLRVGCLCLVADIGNSVPL